MFNAEMQLAARHARLGHFTNFVVMNVAAVLANTYLVLSFASGAGLAGRLCLVASIVTVATVVPLAVRTILSEIVSIAKDQAKSFEGTFYLGNIQNVPNERFVMLILLLNLAVASLQVWAVFAG